MDTAAQHAPLVGFRMWMIANDTLMTSNDHRWEIGVNRAECVAGEHDAHDVPRADCDCGLYAMKQLQDPAQYDCEYCEALDHSARAHPYYLVPGLVRMWGRVEVHPTGMRAEYATPVALAVTNRYATSHQRVIRNFAKNHYLDLLAWKDFPRRAYEYGTILPAQALDEKHH